MDNMLGRGGLVTSLVIVTLALAACGDSGGTGSASASSSSAGSTSTADGSTTASPTTTGTPTSSTSGDDGSGTAATLDMMTEPGTSGVVMTTTGSDDTTGAPAPVCGDGNLDPDEACDEGANNSDTGTCTTACKLPACGDGFMQAGEECDDANDIDEDACVSDCKLNICGDGHVGPGEACDAPGDPKCTNECALVSCGDGKVSPGEECDDANDIATDACLPTCLTAKCGDGEIQEGVDTCDDANTDNSDACTTLCKPPACDDGILSGSESDVDCGGSCQPCAEGKECLVGADCGTKVCKANKCVLGLSCQEIRDSTPGAKTGLYDVDLDGPGPEPKLQVECEMDTDTGGWTLVQRTVWDSAKTAALFTGYADWQTKTVGSVAPGEGFRLAGKWWDDLAQKKRHMLVHRLRKVSGESCSPLFYVGSNGTLVVDDVGATLTGLNATVNMINNTILSTQNSGPSQTCINVHGGAPWFYSGCCSTCPTFAGSYWPSPHPMINYSGVPDQFASTSATVCGGDPIATSSGYTGLNEMAYYIR